MSETPKKLVVDLEKGTHAYVDLTPEEIEQRELDAIAAATAEAERQAAAEAEAEAKSSGIAKLLALGLTEEEANALIK